MDLTLTKKLLRNKLALALLAAVVTSLAFAVPAYAHYVYEDGTTYADADGCTWNRAEISHGNGGGYSKSTVRAKRTVSNTPCMQTWERPYGNLRAKWALYRDNFICISVGYTVNSNTTHTLNVTRYHGNTPPCGDGDYETTATGHHKINGVWQGGSIDSGTHYLD